MFAGFRDSDLKTLQSIFALVWFLNKLKWGIVNNCAHRDRGRTHGLHRSTPGPQHIYYGFLINVFLGFLSVQMSWSLILVSSFRIFCSCWFILSCWFNVIAHVLSYSIWVYHIWVFLSEACSLQRRERKGTHPGGSRDGGKVGGAEEGEAAVRIHHVRKDYFQ